MSAGRELTPVRPREARRLDGSVSTSYTFRYVDVLGRKRRVTRSSYEAALEAWLRIKGLRDRGRLDELERGSTTLARFHDEVWLPEHAPTLTPKSVAHYETLWRRHVVERIGGLAMRDVTPRVASGLKQQMLAAGTGIETTRRTMTLLQGIFRLAIEWEEATTNPFAVVRKPPIKPPAPVRPLAVEAVERLRAYFLAAEEWESLLVCVLMAYAGLRPSEVAALRLGDVRERTLLVHRAVRLGDHSGLKNGSAYRTVELLQPVKDDVALVAAALGFSADASDTPLVPNSAGEVRDEDDYKNWRRRQFRPAVAELGLSIRRPYDLRHTCASLMIAAQRNIRGQPPIDIEARIETVRAGRTTAAPLSRA